MLFVNKIVNIFIWVFTYSRKTLCKYTKNVQMTKKQETKCQFLMKILSFIKNNLLNLVDFSNNTIKYIVISNFSKKYGIFCVCRAFEVFFFYVFFSVDFIKYAPNILPGIYQIEIHNFVLNIISLEKYAINWILHIWNFHLISSEFRMCVFVYVSIFHWFQLDMNNSLRGDKWID